MSLFKPTDLPLLMIGAGGHAKVLHALLRAAGLRLLGVCDPELARQGLKLWHDVPVLGGDDGLADHPPGSVALVNGIGQVVGSTRRADVAARLDGMGYVFPVVVHPHAWIADDAELASGVQVMAGAVIQPGCRLGANTIVNTRAGVDHDCTLGANVHIAPAATLCGGVWVGDHAFVGAGATVSQGVRIGVRAIAGAGVTLVRDLPQEHKVFGASPRLMQEC